MNKTILLIALVICVGLLACKKYTCQCTQYSGTGVQTETHEIIEKSAADARNTCESGTLGSQNGFHTGCVLL